MGKLILHVGLPKTATSAIQTELYESRDLLISHDVIYPNEFLKPNPPKHQKLVKSFYQSELSEMVKCLEKYKNMTLIFSTEGLTNHFYDFPQSTFDAFKKITKNIEVTIVYVNRELDDWLKSYYSQAVFNPQSKKVSYYGTDYLYEEFIKLDRVIELSDTKQLKSDLINNFTPSKFIELTYSKNIVDDFYKALNLPRKKIIKSKQVNYSPPIWSVELMRQINQMTKSEIERGYWKNIIKEVTQSQHNMLNQLSIKNSNHMNFKHMLAEIKTNTNHIFRLKKSHVNLLKKFINNDR